MDFYKIGALKVFADLGALIEEDEMRMDAQASLHRLSPCAADDSKQIKFMDLPTDIIQNNISKYLLEDKKINKIFHNQEDNELKYVLFGNDIELPYMNLNNRGNKIEVKNDEL